MRATEPPPTGLYIHWPFCDRICPYCDFTVAKNKAVNEAAWEQALLADIAYWAERVGRRPLVSIYFGGGTPSLMNPALVERLLEAAEYHFGLADDIEVTLEANPTDAEVARFQRFRAAGINRLSLGIQSFDDDQLRFLGRNHDGASARGAVETALKCYDQVTFDLIYALPGETLEEWASRLRDAVAMGSRHLSLYQLTVEPGTAFAKAVDRREWSPLDEAAAADLYIAAGEIMAAAGVPAYEVSNYAAMGQRAVHNSLYWKGADWVAIGPGAHGRITSDTERWATEASPSVKAYTDGKPDTRFSTERLDAHAVVTERLAGGLRPVEGLSLDQLPLWAQDEITRAREKLTMQGLLLDRVGCLQPSPQGRLLIDYIVRELVAAL